MPSSNEHHVREPTMLALKAEGALLALAAGDALGWPQEMRWNIRGSLENTPAQVEFRQWTRRSGGRYQPYEEIIRPGEYSDDTQLALAIARSRTKHGSEWWKALTRVELPLWMLYERGGGGATKRAANAWTSNLSPWRSGKKENVRRYFGAGGNGVAMRVLPHALFLSGQETAKGLMHDVVLDGSATHGHPRALVGATVYAHAAWSLMRKSGTLLFGELLDRLIDEAPVWSEFPTRDGKKGSWFEAADEATNGYEPLWNRTVREMHELLEAARRGVQAGALADDRTVLKDLGCFGHAKGAGTISAAAAAYLAARHAAQPKQAVLRAAFEKGADTDTLAAMAGGLVGCTSGIEWLPQPWLQVQDAEYLRRIASRIVLGPDGADRYPVKPLSNPRSIFSHLASNGDQEVFLGGSIRARAVVLPDPKPISKSISVSAWRLHTADGQTMYLTKVRRLAKDSRSVRPSSDSQAMPRALSSRAAGDTDSNPKHALYAEFCRQWWTNFGTREVKRRDVATAMDLVPSQVNKWLNRAEQDGWIQRTSQNPAKYVIRRQQQTLL